MEKPGDLLRRAHRNRRSFANRETLQTQNCQAQPRNISSHANYTALMRSHDRVHTRHIGGQGGAGRA